MLKEITFKLIKGDISLTIDTEKRKIMVKAKADDGFSFNSVDIFESFRCRHISSVYLDSEGKGEVEYSKEWDWLFKQESIHIWKNIYLVTP